MTRHTTISGDLSPDIPVWRPRLRGVYHPMFDHGGWFEEFGRMDLLRSLCSVPTAPFAEGQVVDFVRQFVREQRGLRLSEDEWGNLLIECAGTDRKEREARMVFAAHMDHP